MSELKKFKCPCGEEHVYPQQNMQDSAEDIIARGGPTVIINDLRSGKSYEMQRVYLCFHSIRPSELEAAAKAGIIKEVPA